MKARARGELVITRQQGPEEVQALTSTFNEMVRARLCAEKDLREQDARLRLAMAAANIGLWDWHVQDSRIYLSPEWKHQLGYDAEDFPDECSAMRRRLHPADRRRAVAALHAAMNAGALRHEDEYRVQTKDGEFRHVYCRAELIRDNRGAVTRIVGAHIDVTRRKQTELDLSQAMVRLRALSLRVAEVEANERRHISRELHDRIGGNVAALRLNLQTVQAKLEAVGLKDTAAIVEDAQQIVTATSAEVRTLMEELRPPALDDFGLVAALRTHADGIARSIGVTLDFQAPRCQRVAGPAAETALFRIAQEALTNIAKHACATHIEIHLSIGEEAVELAICDDGAGFPHEAARTGGDGLRNMRERAEAVGGSVQILSSLQRGTRVVVTVPR